MASIWEILSGIDFESMAVEPSLVFSIQAYVDAVLDLASHFITRLRRYASFCRTLASHAASAGTGGNRSVVTSPTQSTSTPATTSGAQGGTASSTGSTQMQAWVQGAIAKISNTPDGVPSSAPNPISGPSIFMPLSINTGTFPGTPAVRLIGDCHFLHRLCQLLLFCFFFRRTQLPQFIGAAQRNTDSTIQKPQPGVQGKSEETNSVTAKPATAVVRSDETQATRTAQVGNGPKGPEEGPTIRSRLGSGNAGQGYTFEELWISVGGHQVWHILYPFPRWGAATFKLDFIILMETILCYQRLWKRHLALICRICPDLEVKMLQVCFSGSWNYILQLKSGTRGICFVDPGLIRMMRVSQTIFLNLAPQWIYSTLLHLRMVILIMELMACGQGSVGFLKEMQPLDLRHRLA